MKKIWMLDDFYLLHDARVKRVLCAPEWDFGETYFDPAFPAGVRFFSVVTAPVAGYDMFLSTFAPDKPVSMRGGGLTIGVAHSDDGRHFGPVHPLGPGGAHGLSVAVYRDERETNANCRYKGIESDIFYVDGQGEAHAGPSYVVASGDGTRWTRYSENHVVRDSCLDCQPSALYNPYTKKYQVTLRRAHGDRRISLAESTDFINWSEPRCILHPGTPLDAPGTHFYSMPHFYLYGSDVFVGFLWKLHMPYDRVSDGPMTTELVYSYDGITWNRTLHSLLPIDHIVESERAVQGAPRACALVMSLVEERDGHLILYALVGDYEHQCWPKPGQPFYRMHTARLRPDGFACYRAADAPGEAITVALNPRLGSELRLNYRTLPRGRIRAALCDPSGHTLPGFGMEDCLLPGGDFTAFTVRWRDVSLVDALAASPWVRLRFSLENAMLYAIGGDFRAAVNSTGKPYERP